MCEHEQAPEPQPCCVCGAPAETVIFTPGLAAVGLILYCDTHADEILRGIANRAAAPWN